MHQDLFKDTKIVFYGILCMVLAAFAGALNAPPGMFKDIDDNILGQAIIINGKQLFIDDYIIGEVNDVKKVLNQPVKHPTNPIFGDKEKELGGYGSVIYDQEEKIFKMWYEKTPDCNIPGMLYATSNDGIVWQKPTIGQNDGNNLVPTPKESVFVGGSGIYKDYFDPDPKRRYKMLYVGSTTYRNLDMQNYLKNLGTYAAYSSDGIHWIYEPQNPVSPFSDTHTVPFWDPQRNRYVAYLRYGPPNTRGVSRIESEDFVHWSPKVTVFPQSKHPIDKPFSTTLYGMEIMPYEEIYIGLLTPYHGETIQPIPKDKEEWMDKVDVQLGFSRNGLTWMRVGKNGAITQDEIADPNRDWQKVAKEATFIPYGQHKKDWDWGQIYPFQGPVIFGDEIRIYYAGTANRHWASYHGDTVKIAIGIATLRLDGFISVNAGQEEGTMTTKPLVFIGDALEINANAQSGSIQVEALDGDGKVIEGFGKSDCEPLTEDKVHHIVKWKSGSDCHLLQARPIRLKFYLKNAKLYSFKPRILYNHFIPSYD